VRAGLSCAAAEVGLSASGAVSEIERLLPAFRLRTDEIIAWCEELSPVGRFYRPPVLTKYWSILHSWLLLEDFVPHEVTTGELR